MLSISFSSAIDWKVLCRQPTAVQTEVFQWVLWMEARRRLWSVRVLTYTQMEIQYEHTSMTSAYFWEWAYPFLLLHPCLCLFPVWLCGFMPWVEWVVPAPLLVSSTMSKLSKQKWHTLFWEREILEGKRLSSNITKSAIAVSNSKVWSYDWQCPNLFMIDISWVLPLRWWSVMTSKKCLFVFHWPFVFA